MRQIVWGLGDLREIFDLAPRPLDHLLEITEELSVDRIVRSVEGIKRCRARGVKNREHAELLPNRFIHALRSVFRLRDTRNRFG